MTFAIGLLVIVAILIAFHCFVRYGRKGRYLNKIPGPVAFPLVGNTPQYIGTTSHIWKFVRYQNKKYYPTYRVYGLTRGDVNIAHPDDIEILLSSTKQIDKSRIYDLLHVWFGTGLLTSTGKKWQTRRKILTPAFHYSILQQFSNIFNDHSIRLVDELKRKNDEEIVVELLNFFSDYSLNTICETALGTPIHNQKDYCDKYRAAVYAMGGILSYRLVRFWLHFKCILDRTKTGKMQADALDILQGFTKKIIKERRQYHRETNGKFLENLSSESPKQAEENELYFTNSIHKKKRLAMLDLLIAASKETGEIDDAGIQEEVDTFLFEGHDTTAMNLCFTSMLLAEHKEIQEKARREVDQVMRECDGILNMSALQKLTYLEMCIKEALRLYPSVPFISRNTTEDLQLTKYFIPAGQSINVHIFDCHRDSNFWPDPLKYDPDRFLPEKINKRHPYQYIPFSGGPRNCIGQKFALLENKNVLARLLHNFYFEPVELTSEINFQVDLVLRPTHPIHIKFVKRHILQ